MPLSHVYERVTAYAYLFHGVPISYVERMDDLPQALVEVHPTLAAAVPRVFEKLYANIMQKGHATTGLKRTHFRLGHARGPGFGAMESVLAKHAPLRAATSLEDCGPHRVFQNSRRGRRPLSRLHLRRRAAFPRACRILLGRGRARLSGIRPDGDFAGGERELSGRK